MGSIESRIGRHQLLFDKPADQPKSQDSSLSVVVAEYIQGLTEQSNTPNEYSPDTLNALKKLIQHGAIIREHQEIVRKAATALTEAQDQLTEQQIYQQTLQIRVAIRMALDSGDTTMLKRIVNDPEGIKALASGDSAETEQILEDLETAQALDDASNSELPPAESIEQSEGEEPQNETTSETPASIKELNATLSGIGAPLLQDEQPKAVIVKQEKEDQLSWEDVFLGKPNKSEQQNLTNIMNKLIPDLGLQRLEGDILGAIQQLTDMDPDFILLALQENYKDNRSQTSVARFLSLYHRMKEGEYLSSKQFLKHASLIINNQTNDLLPLAENPKELPKDSSAKIIGGKNDGTAKTNAEQGKNLAMGHLMELFRDFYAAIEAKNFQEHWPVDAGRLVVIYGKFSTTFVEKAMKDGIVNPLTSKKQRLSLTEQDAIRLLLYKKENLETLSTKRANQKLDQIMQYYWEARDKFAQEIGDKLPYPGLDR